MKNHAGGPVPSAVPAIPGTPARVVTAPAGVTARMDRYGKVDSVRWQIRQIRLTNAMATGEEPNEQAAIAAARREAAAQGFDDLLVEHKDLNCGRTVMV